MSILDSLGPPSPLDVAEQGEARRLLTAIAAIAAVDACLLVLLVAAAIAGDHGITSLVGPIHGVGFLVEVVLATRGVGQGFWTWRLPALIFVTLGPPGAYVGHRRLTPGYRSTSA